jgi:hypothetical protein
VIVLGARTVGLRMDANRVCCPRYADYDRIAVYGPDRGGRRVGAGCRSRTRDLLIINQPSRVFRVAGRDARSYANRRNDLEFEHLT